MSYIKDAIDLTQDLNDRAESREFSSEVREILKLIMDAYREQVAVEKRNLELAAENSQLKRKIAELEKGDNSSVTWGRDKPSRMSGEETKILQALAHIKNQNAVRLSQEIGASEQKTKYYLNELCQKNLAVFAMVSDQEDLTYNLTEEGRAWLFEADLLD